MHRIGEVDGFIWLGNSRNQAFVKFAIESGLFFPLDATRGRGGLGLRLLKASRAEV